MFCFVAFPLPGAFIGARLLLVFLDLSVALPSVFQGPGRVFLAPRLVVAGHDDIAGLHYLDGVGGFFDGRVDASLHTPHLGVLRISAHGGVRETKV